MDDACWLTKWEMLCLCQLWQTPVMWYYVILTDLYDGSDTEPHSHEWESACWVTLFVFGRWTVRALQDEPTGCDEDSGWQKDVSSSLRCTVPISGFWRAAHKTSNGLQEGGKKEPGVAEILHIRPRAHMHPLPSRRSKILCKSLKWWTSNSPRYKSNRNEKKI